MIAFIEQWGLVIAVTFVSILIAVAVATHETPDQRLQRRAFDARRREIEAEIRAAWEKGKEGK